MKHLSAEIRRLLAQMEIVQRKLFTATRAENQSGTREPNDT
jgi:hypothetical protein